MNLRFGAVPVTKCLMAPTGSRRRSVQSGATMPLKPEGGDDVDGSDWGVHVSNGRLGAEVPITRNPMVQTVMLR